MQNVYSVGVKFKHLEEVTAEELQKTMERVDRLSIEFGRAAVIRCKDRHDGDIFYDFLDRDKAIGFQVSASNVPNVLNCHYDNQPLF